MLRLFLPREGEQVFRGELPPHVRLHYDCRQHAHALPAVLVVGLPPVLVRLADVAELVGRKAAEVVVSKADAA